MRGQGAGTAPCAADAPRSTLVRLNREIFSIFVRVTLLLAAASLPAAGAQSTPGWLENEGDTPGTDPLLKEMYEEFPFPPPPAYLRQDDVPVPGADAVQGLLDQLGVSMTHHPELSLAHNFHLADVQQALFNGSRDLCGGDGRPFRVLYAGGGASVKSFTMASQLHDMGADYEIVHLDLSEHSVRVARRRLRSRPALRDAPVRFVVGSIFDLPTLGLGLFDYVDVTGVVHHTSAPARALAILRDALAPGGGMGVMVYAAAYAEGVFQVRRALELLRGGGDGAHASNVAAARDVLLALPPTHPLRANPGRWRALRAYLDAADGTDRLHTTLADMFAVAAVRAYSLPQTRELLAEAGLAMVPGTLTPPAAYWLWPALGGASSAAAAGRLGERVERRLGGGDATAVLDFVELFAGNIHAHTFYAVPAVGPAPPAPPLAAALVDARTGLPHNSTAHWIAAGPAVRAAVLASYVVPVQFSPPAIAAAIRAAPGQVFRWEHLGTVANFPVGDKALAALARVNGRRTVAELAAGAEAGSCDGGGPCGAGGLEAEAAALAVFASMFWPFHGAGRMFLSARPVSERSLAALNNYYDNHRREETDELVYNYFTLEACGGE